MATYPFATRRSTPRAAICPECGRLDQVQRVSAICKAGSVTTRGIARTRGSFWGYGRAGAIWGSTKSSTVIEEEHATQLSEVLAPPEAPQFRNQWGLVSMLLLIAVLLSGWLAIVEVPGFHCATSGQRTVCWSSQSSVPAQSAAGITPNPIVFARLVQTGLVALPVGLLAGLLARRWRLGVRRRRRYEAEYQAWQQDYDRWADLFYCHRCDEVFAPGERL